MEQERNALEAKVGSLREDFDAAKQEGNLLRTELVIYIRNEKYVTNLILGECERRISKSQSTVDKI